MIGIAGFVSSGEISNCINEAEIGGGFADEQGYESGDLFAGGIAGYMNNKAAWKKGLSVLNCGNRGKIISQSGSAGGVAGCQNGELSEIANVWNEAEITTKLEADSVTGTWISGSREHCIDGTQSTPEELCKSLNQWIASADMDEHFTMEGTDPLSTWEVEDGKLQLRSIPEPTVSPVPTKEAATATPKPAKTAEVESSQTPVPAKTAEAALSHPPEETKPAKAEPLQTPGPEKTASAKPAGTAKPEKKRKASAPVFTLKRKKNKENQSYIQVKIKKHYGNYVEVWAKIEKGSYKKLKLSQNRLPALKNKLKFKYTISGKKFYFKIRTYKLKKGKKIYSKMSNRKGIVTR